MSFLQLCEKMVIFDKTLKTPQLRNQYEQPYIENRISMFLCTLIFPTM